MSITVECPHCGRRHKLEAAAAGTVRRCDCGGEFRVPGSKPAPPIPSPRDAASRLSPKSKIMLGALLGVVILGVALHLVQAIHWHIVTMNPEAPILLPRPELSVSELITRLSDEDPDVRGSACGRLGERGKEAVRPLMGVLHSDNDKTRAAAAKALVTIGEPAVPALLTALVGEDTTVATSATWALGEIGDSRAATPLLREFEDHIAAASSLSRPHVDPGRPRTVVDSRGSHEVAARAMARALGQLKATEAAYPFLMAVGTQGSSLDRAIGDALVAMGEGALPVLRENLWNVGPEARTVIINVTTALEDPLPDEDLLRLLKSDEHTVSLAAARTLVGRGDKRALPVLIAAIEEEWPKSVPTAIELLAELGDTRGAPAIISALGHEKSRVRADAAKALGELGHGDAVEPLIAALKDKDSQVVNNAALALGQIGDRRAFEPLVATFKDCDYWVAESVAKALGELGDPRAIEPLIDALATGKYYFAIKKALVALGPPAAPPLVALLADEKTNDRLQVFGVLQAMKADALDALLAGLETANPDGRENIFRLLRYLDDDPRAQAAIDRAEAAADGG
jgi:HEAT repeat protein